MLDYISLIDRAREAGKFRSDSALAKAIDLTKGSIWAMRNSRKPPSDLTIMRLCEILREDPSPYLLEAQVMRADEKTRPLWEKMAEQLAS